MVAQQKRIRLGTISLRDQFLALLSGIGIWHCHEEWCRLQMWLGSCVAVAVVSVGSCSSDLTPSLGISTCKECGPKKKRQKKKKKECKKDERQKPRRISWQGMKEGPQPWLWVLFLVQKSCILRVEMFLCLVASFTPRLFLDLLTNS